jgi:hypothetical protein
MAIRKDIDDMLKNLKGNEPEKPAKNAASESSPLNRTDKIDIMSVDELLNSLTHPSEPAEKPVPDAPEPEKPKRKKIVISGELPDYEAIRAAELEKDRIAAEKKAAEEAAEKARIEAERQAAEAERARIEAERKAAEEAVEKARLEAERRAAEEAAEMARIEAERKAAEEAAERARIEAERQAAEEAAEKARIEAEKKAAEEAAERARIEAERKAAEEAIEKARIEAERRAAEEAAEKARIEAERQAAEEAEKTPVSLEEEINVVSSSIIENASSLSVDELMAAAIAAVKKPDASEKTDSDETENASEEESDPVSSMIDGIREDAERTIADMEKAASEKEEEPAEEEEVPVESAEERKKRFFSKKAELEETETEQQVEKPKGKITAALENIMDEDPDEIILERSEKAEADSENGEKSGGKFKKNLYTVLGIVFALLACVGLITIIAKGASFFGSYTSGDAKKDSFSEVLYPVVIMDIESFDEPSQLTSEQVVTAAIWSMIMSDGVMDQYEKTFDVVRVPAVDVESYAVKLFGENLPELTHTTVGPAESRFYFNEETKSYNVPVKPITFTYSPSIKSVTKSGSDYTVVVDYIDELPEWIPETSSKSVQYTLTETNEGYQIKSMKVLSATTNM